MNRSHIVLAVAAFALSSAVHSQSRYPEKPVRIVAGFQPGAPADVMARVIGQKLSEFWAKPVIIENLPGAVGNLGAARVAKSPPDGRRSTATDRRRSA